MGRSSVDAFAGGTVTSAVTVVPASAVNVTLLASERNRLMTTIFNGSDQTMYVKFGSTASLVSYTFRLPSGAYYEMQTPQYLGRVDAIWSGAGTGNAFVTELMTEIT